MIAMIVTEDVDTLDADGLVRRLGEVELLRRRLFRRLDEPAPPAARPAPAAPVRGAALKVSEVMERLKVSKSYVYRAINSGRLPVIRVGSRSLRIPESALAKLERVA